MMEFDKSFRDLLILIIDELESLDSRVSHIAKSGYHNSNGWKKLRVSLQNNNLTDKCSHGNILTHWCQECDSK